MASAEPGSGADAAASGGVVAVGAGAAGSGAVAPVGGGAGSRRAPAPGAAGGGGSAGPGGRGGVVEGGGGDPLDARELADVLVREGRVMVADGVAFLAGGAGTERLPASLAGAIGAPLAW